MSFGFSAGDIAECIRLFIKIGTALKESGGSAAEYQNAVGFLEGIERTVQVVERLLEAHQDLTHRTDLEIHTRQLVSAVIHFREKTKGYEASLGANPTTSQTKKAWKKIKLELFGNIEKLKSDILCPHIIVKGLIAVQSLQILVDLSEKPTVSPQQIQDLLVPIIETLRSNISEDWVTAQQAAEITAQKNFDQILQDVSTGLNMQRLSSTKVDKHAERQELWQSEIQISLEEIQVEAGKHFEEVLSSINALPDTETRDCWQSQVQGFHSEIRDETQKICEVLEEVKQTQEASHLHNLQTSLFIPLRNAFRPIVSRPIVKVVKKTIIKTSQPARQTLPTRNGSSKGGDYRGSGNTDKGPKGGISKGASSSKGNASSHGVKAQANNSSAKQKSTTTKGVKSQGSDTPAVKPRGSSGLTGGSQKNKANTQGGGGSRGGSSGASNPPRGGLVNGGSTHRGGNCDGRGSKRGVAGRVANSGGGNTRGGGGRVSDTQNRSSKANPPRGGGSSRAAKPGGGSGGGRSQGATSRGNSSRVNKPQEVSGGSSNVPGRNARGAKARGSSTRRGRGRGGSLRGANVRGRNS